MREKRGPQKTLSGTWVRSTLAVAFVILMSANARAATKVFLHDASSKLIPNGDFLYKLADGAQGTSLATAVTASANGEITGQYWPSSDPAHIITKTSAGPKIVWISSPLSAGVTVSGTITAHLWGLESARQCNCAVRFEVLRWSAARGGIVSSLGISSDSAMSEWDTRALLDSSLTVTPTATVFAAGDRIVIVIYNDNASGTNEGANRDWTLDYDGPSGGDGDAYLSFTEAFSFAPDTNNARPMGLSSELFFRFHILNEIFPRPPELKLKTSGRISAINIGGYYAK